MPETITTEDTIAAQYIMEEIRKLNKCARLPAAPHLFALSLRKLQTEFDIDLNEIKTVFDWHAQNEWWSGRITNQEGLHKNWPSLYGAWQSDQKKKQSANPLTHEAQDAHFAEMGERRKQRLQQENSVIQS